jgi:hypothetical protein
MVTVTEKLHTQEDRTYQIKETKNLSPRIQWLRDYYFRGVERAWNNEYTAWTTGTPWDFQYEEATFHIVPETYSFLETFRSSYQQVAHQVELPPDFWQWSLPERRAWFNKEVMVDYLPQEILPGDLIAGGRFNVMTSTCLTKKQTRNYLRKVKSAGKVSMQIFRRITRLCQRSIDAVLEERNCARC